MKASRGISLHIGLNRIDSGHYGTDGSLGGCENDAHAMQRIASMLGYQSKLLLTTEATSAAVLGAIRAAAGELEAGDTLLVTYAGHGAQLPDEDGDEEEGRDETWCVYDRMIVDDELYTLWGQCKPGVLIVLVSDSCHSGTVARRLSGAMGEGGKARALSPVIARQTYEAHRELYAAVRAGTSGGNHAPIKPALISLSGCLDHQLSADGNGNGLFTEKLLLVWNQGAFSGSYPDFIDGIVRLMPNPADQMPSCDANDSAAPFLRGRPFQIPAAAPVNGAANPETPPASNHTAVHECTCPAAVNTPTQPVTNKEDFNMDTVIDNGNWTDVAPLIALQTQGKRGGGNFMETVIAANARSAELALANSPDLLTQTTYDTRAYRGGSVVRGFWWGFHIQLAREDLRFLYTVTDPNGEFCRMLRTIIPQNYMWVYELVRVFVQISQAVIKAADRGNGVYISMSWFAPGIFVPTPV